jgi:hypothetical protein
MERDKCYVNPFVGEGRYARYLRNWLEVVPSRQMLLLNFDEWTTDAEGTMRRVFAFLQLKPYTRHHHRRPTPLMCTSSAPPHSAHPPP